MSDRTTINVPKSEHTAAGNVKEEYNDTWTDVLSFYATYAPQVYNDGLGRENQPMQDVDTSELRQIVKYQEQTIDELEQQRDMLVEIVNKSVTLDASERAQIARDVADELR